MKLEEKINFLKLYKKTVKLIAPEEISHHSPAITDKWCAIFSNHNMTERMTKIIDMWKQSHAKEMSIVIRYLEENLKAVNLITYDDKYFILYEIYDRVNEHISYYEGALEMDFGNNNKLKERWQEVPASIRNFYENIHNGFYHYPSHSGLNSLAEVTYFDDYEWGIVEDLEEPVQIDFASTFGFFSNGGGGYIALDLNSEDKEQVTIWFHDDEPEYDENFWDVLDEWLVILFEV